MSLKEKLADDLKAAMKSKDVLLKNTVQMVRAAVLQVEKDNRTELDDEGVLQVISKELKKRRDVLPEYEKSGREDLVTDLKREIEILLAYLPEQMSPEEVEAVVMQVITETGASSMRDMGKVMPEVLKRTKSMADGKLVNELVRKHLS